eukprot:gnl/TRDRNA2_/TRDRNA2_179974_c0_seq1.p1 gnl/TRDRNA2_/TRDRNA2_179974_c0~~gnl/TRDRNA2_/TRDRNA2_179974_c0_seq1.p1  ORF type:complete len:171 (-),score=64.45 gnl/TRDRNA2_/TRDRNA2_179974_c0_seq1:61-573(-)
MAVLLVLLGALLPLNTAMELRGRAWPMDEDEHKPKDFMDDYIKGAGLAVPAEQPAQEQMQSEPHMVPRTSAFDDMKSQMEGVMENMQAKVQADQLIDAENNENKARRAPAKQEEQSVADSIVAPLHEDPQPQPEQQQPQSVSSDSSSPQQTPQNAVVDIKLDSELQLHTK